MEESACLEFCEALILDDILKQLAAISELHDEEDVVCGFDDLENRRRELEPRRVG